MGCGMIGVPVAPVVAALRLVAATAVGADDSSGDAATGSAPAVAQLQTWWRRVYVERS
jgi:hypothetical protein